MLLKSVMKKSYKCEIDCAACAAKVEEAIKKIDGVENVNINFLTQKISITADEEKFNDVLKAACKAGKKIEPDFSIDI